MITNTGKKILAKYLIGQTPSYASHIAVGCGARPLDSSLPNFEDYSNKESLDFEMFRTPIISRGFVTENGVTSVVLTAEAPTAERYEITELGIYPAASNPSAGDSGSKNLFLFSESENWEHHVNLVDGGSVTKLPIIKSNDEPTGPAFITSSSSSIFDKERLESPRFLADAVLVSGSDGILTEDGSRLVEEEGSNHIHYNGITLSSIDSNSSDDEIRLAFSVINATSTSAVNPTKVKMLVDFQSTEGSLASAQSAKWFINIVDGEQLANGDIVDFETNRYYVVSTKKGELATTAGFTWASVTSIKISVDVDGSDDFYVALDAMRLVNATTENPLYGLVGYSKIKSFEAKPILKDSNTRSFIEFRFGIDMGTDVVS